MSEPIHILFVDDQWCRPDSRGILMAEFGPLRNQDPPCVFHFETAEDRSGGYSSKPVLKRLRDLPEGTVVILDIMFGESDDRLGLEILEEVRALRPFAPVFMMTSLDNSVEVVERAMELGANEYLIKRPMLGDLQSVLRAYTQSAIVGSDHAIWGNSPAVRRLRALIARVAFGGSASVVVTGESGTGKELVARSIHRQGPRRSGPFIDKSCAFDRSELLDDDLFGHEKGAFTGADRQHQGRIERANGGVLFLDEIGDMSGVLQGKLLRVLEARHFQRLGGSRDVHSDFQLICATNVDPDRLIRAGKLRPDLYFRIHQVLIPVPPLRERPDDIQMLAQFFLRRFRGGAGASYRAERFSKEALSRFAAYAWPGNIRELRNVVERAVILSSGPVVGSECLSPELLGPRAEAFAPIDGEENALPPDDREWPRHRLLAELRIVIEAKRRVQSYKGTQWKAELMRRLYPECKAGNAKGFADLIRRLTKGPWGDPNLREDEEIGRLLQDLER